MIEHNLAVADLMNGGSLRAKAEQVINGRKLAYNRALREFKKEMEPPSTRNGYPRKSNKNGKHVSSQGTQDGY